MTLVQGHTSLCREHLSVAFPDFSLSFESRDKLFDQPTGIPKIKLSVTVIPNAFPAIPKYTKKNL